MKIYLVGGAVRDKLLNIPLNDKDWVVVGATVTQMLKQNFQQVGKDFPVFLHPGTKEEYALARTERKTGKGYTGFTVHASSEVTLEEDLARRDLTINAMAETEDGKIIDPYNGQVDIKNKILRHVSPAFAEDPLRILRVARFAARFSHLGFTIAEETVELMKEIVLADELSYLSAERIWQEIQRALSEKSPRIFIQSLLDCGALLKILPELNALFGVPQAKENHPEIDSGIHSLMVLEQACIISQHTAVRFAALIHDLGKSLTPQAQWPFHKDHEMASAKLVNSLCARLKVPNEYRELGKLASLYHGDCHQAKRHNGQELYNTLEQTDALRRPERFDFFLNVCEADAKGRKGFEKKPYPQATILRKALNIAKKINAKELLTEGYKGKEIASQLKLKRILAIQESL